MNLYGVCEGMLLCLLRKCAQHLSYWGDAVIFPAAGGIAAGI